jgi:ATP-binding cassette, subfamily C (CFTR/MRP), member 1
MVVERSSKFYHTKMLSSVLRNKLSFFESTPLGRIINRFSVDIEQVEMIIPNAYRYAIRCIFQMLIITVVITLSTPLFLIPLAPLIVVYILFQVTKFFNVLILSSSFIIYQLERGII